MNAALYVGSVAHRRFVPKKNGFRYPFFMWSLNLDRVTAIPDIGRWFSTRRFAMSRFHRPDYLGPPEEPLHVCVKREMAAITGIDVEGEVWGVLNLRTMGLYFSPVNFYFGYDDRGRCSHMLAEVSNIPWNERHHYAHYIGDGHFKPSQRKAFKVSPFNPVEQEYRWYIESPGENLRIGIEVHDERGQVFEARLDLTRQPLTPASVRRQLLKKPAMTASIVGGIYWHALKLYLKGVPYIPYQKEPT